MHCNCLPSSHEGELRGLLKHVVLHWASFRTGSHEACPVHCNWSLWSCMWGRHSLSAFNFLGEEWPHDLGTFNFLREHFAPLLTCLPFDMSPHLPSDSVLLDNITGCTVIGGYVLVAMCWWTIQPTGCIVIGRCCLMSGSWRASWNM